MHKRGLGIGGQVIEMVITGNGNYQYLPVITTPFFQLLPADLPRGKLPTPARGGAGGRQRRKGGNAAEKGTSAFLLSRCRRAIGTTA